MSDYQKQMQELKTQIKLLKQLGTAEGFYQYYFSELKNYRTNIECFNAVNDLYLDLFGEYRYSSWHSFCTTRHYKNQKRIN
jgi:hypothetical protein